jgi:hypothetical protein
MRLAGAAADHEGGQSMRRGSFAGVANLVPFSRNKLETGSLYLELPEGLLA